MQEVWNDKRKVMGTNYYARGKKCKECGNETTPIHLGKSSAGWQFNFQWNGGNYYTDVKEMKAWLKGKKIMDEYGKNTSQKLFWQMVNEKQKPEFKNHAVEYPSKDTFMIDGYSFTDSRFS